MSRGAADSQLPAFLLSFLPALNPGGVQIAAPVDMAVRIWLAGSPPLRSYFRNSDNQLSLPDAVLPCCSPLRPCLSPGCCDAVATGTALLGEAATDGGQADLRRRRKQVAFADSWGLALTTVHVFDESEDDLLAELQFQLTEMKDAVAKLSLQEVTGEASVQERVVAAGGGASVSGGTGRTLS